jgi:hypothetical protein
MVGDADRTRLAALGDWRRNWIGSGFCDADARRSWG